MRVELAEGAVAVDARAPRQDKPIDRLDDELRIGTENIDLTMDGISTADGSIAFPVGTGDEG